MTCDALIYTRCHEVTREDRPAIIAKAIFASSPAILTVAASTLWKRPLVPVAVLAAARFICVCVCVVLERERERARVSE